MQIKFWKHAVPTMPNDFIYSAITYLKIAGAWACTRYLNNNSGFGLKPDIYFSWNENGAPLSRYDCRDMWGCPLMGYGARWHRYVLIKHEPTVYYDPHNDRQWLGY